MRHYYPYHPQQQHQQRYQGYGDQPYPEMAYPPQHQHIYRQITMEEAIGISREQMPGQVVKAELESKYGRLICEVDIVFKQGQYYEVKGDANTGEVIEVELD